MRYLSLALFALLACGLFPAAGSAQASTVVVSPGDVIADRIALANEDGYLVIESGDYQGDFEVNVDNLTIRGANYGRSAGTNPDSRPNAESVIVGNITVNAKRLTIDGVKIIGTVRFASGGSGQVNLINNIYSCEDSAHAVESVDTADSLVRFTIRDSRFSRYSDAAVKLEGDAVDKTVLSVDITDSVFSNTDAAVRTGTGLHSDRLEGKITGNEIKSGRIGISIGGGGGEGFLIANNFFLGTGTGAGIVIRQNSGSLAGLTITENEISTFNSGITLLGGTEIEDVLISENNFSDNLNFGVRYDVNPALLDARYNYWGHETGPSDGAMDPVENVPAEGIGDRVAENVRFFPFYEDPLRTRLGGEEYQVSVRVEIDGGGRVDIKRDGQVKAVISGDGDFFTVHYDRRAGVELELTAQPHEGYNFIRWYVDGEDKGDADTYILGVEDNHNVKAVFRGDEVQVPEPDIVGEGAVALDPEDPPYYEGDNLWIIAEPANGYVFEKTEIKFEDEDEPEEFFESTVKVTLDRNIESITVTFLQAPTPPSNLNAAAGENRITLTWNAAEPEPGNATYLIYYNTEGFDASYSLAGEKPGAGKSSYEFVHTGLTNNVRYFYFVITRDEDSGVDSTRTSNRVSAVPGAPEEPVEIDDPVDLAPPEPHDPAAPPVRRPVLTTETRVSGGDCFIATAAFGSYEAREVAALRDFRDDILLNSSVSGFMVEAYYRVSPALSRVIAESGLLRAAARMHLAPVSLIAEFLAG